MHSSMRINARWRLAAALAALLALAVVVTPVLAAGAGVNGRVLRLEAMGRITGVVPGAVLEFKSLAGSVRRATADKDGYYKIDLPPGKYTYKVQAAGFRDEDAGRGITLTLSEGYAVQNFFLGAGKNDPGRRPPQPAPVPVGTLDGQVVERTADGQLVGIPRATVVLRNPGNIQPLKVVARGDGPTVNGRYVVVLPAASYRGSAMAPGFKTFVDPNPIPVTDGQTTTRQWVLARDTAPAPTAQGIKGVVKVAARGSTPALPPVQVSVVSLAEPGTSGAPFSPDGGGSYRRDLREGRYRVIAEAKGYRTFPSGGSEVAVLRGRYTTVNLWLVPDRPPPSKGLIFVATVYERDAKGVRRLLPGATVNLRKPLEAINKAQRGTTDKDGKVRLQVLDPGSYQALVRMTGYAPVAVAVEIRSVGANAREFELLKSAQPMPVQVILRLRVGERKAGATDVLRPLPGAQVRISQQGRDVKAGTIGADGRYDLPLPAGTYRVEVSLAGYIPPVPLDVTLVKEDVSRIITLTPRVTPLPKQFALDLVVVERPKASLKSVPVPGADITISQPGGTVKSGKTGPAGDFKTTGLAPGSYTVKVSATGYEAASTLVTLANENVRREVVLTRVTVAKKARLDLDVRSRTKLGGQPVAVAAAQVTVSQQGRTVASGKTTASGDYAATGLVPGNYTVEVAGAGYDTARIEVTVSEPGLRRVVMLARAGTPTPTKTVRLDLDVRTRTKLGAQPVAVGGAQVTVSQPGRTVASGKTGPAGDYAAPGLAPGNYTVEVASAGFETARIQITLADQNLRRVVALTQAGKPTPTPTKKARLNLEVKERPKVGTQLLPVAAAQVTVGQPGRMVASGKTGAAGDYAAELTPGTYTVEVAAAGFETGRIQVTLDDQGLRREIVLTRVKTATPTPKKGTFDLDLDIKERPKPGAAPVPVVGAQVTVSQQGRAIAAGKTGAYGDFGKAGLAPGSYNVEVVRPGFETARFLVMLADRNVRREVILIRQKR